MSQTPQTPTTNLSEIFPINLTHDNYQYFQVSPNIDKKTGNRFSWRLSDKKLGYVVIFDKITHGFWVLGKPAMTLPDSSAWQTRLNEIQAQLQADLGDTQYRIQELGALPIMTANIQAELAVQVLKFSGQMFAEELASMNKVKIETDVDYWAETFEFDNSFNPAIAINLRTRMIYQEDLQYFFNHHPDRDQAEKILVGLKVKSVASSGVGTIVRLAGLIGERRDELIAKASSAINQAKLRNASEDEPVVSVMFGKNGSSYDYALAAFKPCVTAETSDLFNVQYGDLLKRTKLSYLERTNFIKKISENIKGLLKEFGIDLIKSLNTSSHPNLFLQPKLDLQNVEMLFGNQVKEIKKHTLRGLRKGGVYRRNSDFQDPGYKIRLGIIKPANMIVVNFRTQLEEQLKAYKFDSILPEESRKSYDIVDLTPAAARAKIEGTVDELTELPLDFVLVFLSDSKDSDHEEQEGGSLYNWIKSRLLRRDIASQFIYENTLNLSEKNSDALKNILNNVVPGILAKTGNLPFVLAEPLKIADDFVGLDVARTPYKNRPGSRNICASIRFYGKQGEFIQYQLGHSLIDGEEIPQQTIDDFFPQARFKGKKVLVYRDGRFRGEEVRYLLTRAAAIQAKFILVECVKSQIPRLYNLEDKSLIPPTRGLGLKLSEREVILVTTKVGENIGVPRPLRLRIHEDGEQASLENLIDATLKLTLLHHGSLRDPRLPIPLYGADIIAYRRLQGIYPSRLDGDRQFWL